VGAYWRQQQGYGKAEALLERKWPEKYNAEGHLTWVGNLYGKGLPHSLVLRRNRIYHGTWGSAPFQSIYQPSTGGLSSLLLMPEWYLIIFVLLILSGLGLFWPPLLLLAAPVALSIFASILQVGLSAKRASFGNKPASRVKRFKLQVITAFLYLIQPLARLRGRLYNGLVPWRQRHPFGLSSPRPHVFALWSERWRTPAERLTELCEALRASGAVVLTGGDYDRWDLEVRCGMLGSTRLLMTIEEHGEGKQMIRIRTWPVCPTRGITLMLLFATLSLLAGLDRSLTVSLLLGCIASMTAIRMLQACGTTKASIIHSLQAIYPGSVETFAAKETARDDPAATIDWSVSEPQINSPVDNVPVIPEGNASLSTPGTNAASPRVAMGATGGE
jgi:hypothetical protein